MPDKYCTLLFLKRGDEILLAMKKRGFGAGKWNGVGGKIEPGETVEQALARECREEIGVIPMHYTKVAESRFIEFHEGKPANMYVHAYFCDEWEDEPKESEEMSPQWFHISDIPYGDMWPVDELWLPQSLAGNLLIADFELDENEAIISHHVHIVDELPGAIPTHA